MAEAASAHAGKPARRGSLLWVQGLACGALLTFAAPTCLVLGVLLAPALASVLGERDAGPGTPRAVALCCGASAVVPVWRLWMEGDQMARALETLSDPLTLVVAWGTGACAWAACQVLPVVIRSVWDLQVAARGRTLQAELTECRAEWDLP